MNPLDVLSEAAQHLEAEGTDDGMDDFGSDEEDDEQEEGRGVTRRRDENDETHKERRVMPRQQPPQNPNSNSFDDADDDDEGSDDDDDDDEEEDGVMPWRQPLSRSNKNGDTEEESEDEDKEVDGGDDDDEEGYADDEDDQDNDGDDEWLPTTTTTTASGRTSQRQAQSTTSSTATTRTATAGRSTPRRISSSSSSTVTPRATTTRTISVDSDLNRKDEEYLRKLRRKHLHARVRSLGFLPIHKNNAKWNTEDCVTFLLKKYGEEIEVARYNERQEEDLDDGSESVGEDNKELSCVIVEDELPWDSTDETLKFTNWNDFQQHLTDPKHFVYNSSKEKETLKKEVRLHPSHDPSTMGSKCVYCNKQLRTDKNKKVKGKSNICDQSFPLGSAFGSCFTLREHGLSLAEFINLYRLQKGRCYFCEEKMDINGKTRLVVHHFHVKGLMRRRCYPRLSHDNCNRGFGSFEKSAKSESRVYTINSVRKIAGSLRNLAKKLDDDADYLSNIR